MKGASTISRTRSGALGGSFGVGAGKIALGRTLGWGHNLEWGYMLGVGSFGPTLGLGCLGSIGHSGFLVSRTHRSYQAHMEVVPVDLAHIAVLQVGCCILNCSVCN